MALSVVMPALEMAQETGKLLAWLKNEGDAIRKGEMIAEIETDKAVFELEAPGDGVLAGVKSNAGDVVPVGQTIAWIVAPGEQPPVESESAAPSARTVTETPSAGGARISPKARRMAERAWRRYHQDSRNRPERDHQPAMIFSLAASQKAAPAPAESLSTLARLMAERTTQSWTQTPHFFLVREVDAGPLVEGPQDSRPVHHNHGSSNLGLSPRGYEASQNERELVRRPHRAQPAVNISLAIAVKDGVVGAVIPDAAKMPLAEIAARRKDLAERARAGRLRPADVTGGTFTLSNLGMYGIDAFSAIITPPQAAVLAVGRIADRVVPVNGEPGIRPCSL